MTLTIKRAIAAIVLVLSLAVPVAAEPLEDGIAAYERGDYATALLLLRPLAEQDGPAEAQWAIGLMYSRGLGVPQNYSEAAKWFRRAAEQGDAFHQFTLGVLYQSGEGLPQNYSEAVKWFRIAAENGDAGAAFQLGFMYDEGEGVRRDYGEAVKWYRLSAERGEPFAQHRLGMMYELGRGVPQDFTQAHKWVNLAASRYPELAATERAKAVEARDALAAKMTPAQIAEAQKLAREWRPQPSR